jgi:hypothetical protein
MPPKPYNGLTKSQQQIADSAMQRREREERERREREERERREREESSLTTVEVADGSWRRQQPPPAAADGRSGYQQPPPSVAYGRREQYPPTSAAERSRRYQQSPHPVAVAVAEAEAEEAEEAEGSWRRQQRPSVAYGRREQRPSVAYGRREQPPPADGKAGILGRTQVGQKVATLTLDDKWYPKYTCEMERVRSELGHVSRIVTCAYKSNISKNDIKQYYNNGTVTPHIENFLLCVNELFGKLKAKIDKYAFIDALCRLNLYEVFENNTEIMNELRAQIVERQSEDIKNKENGGDSIVNYVTSFVYQRPNGELSLGQYGLRDTNFFPFDDAKLLIRLGKKEYQKTKHKHEISPVMEYIYDQVLYRTKQTLYRMLRLIFENGYNTDPNFQYRAQKSGKVYNYATIIKIRLSDQYDESYLQVGLDALEDHNSGSIRSEYSVYQENTTPEDDTKYEAKMIEKVIDPVTGEKESEVDQTQKLRDLRKRYEQVVTVQTNTLKRILESKSETLKKISSIFNRITDDDSKYPELIKEIRNADKLYENNTGLVEFIISKIYGDDEDYYKVYVELINSTTKLKNEFTKKFPTFPTEGENEEQKKDKIKKYIKFLVLAGEKLIDEEQFNLLISQLFNIDSKDSLYCLFELLKYSENINTSMPETLRNISRRLGHLYAKLVKIGGFDLRFKFLYLDFIEGKGTYTKRPLYAKEEARNAEDMQLAIPETTPQDGGRYSNTNRYIHKIEKYSQKIEYLLKK